jgi:hypothetical protein
MILCQRRCLRGRRRLGRRRTGWNGLGWDYEEDGVCWVDLEVGLVVEGSIDGGRADGVLARIVGVFEEVEDCGRGRL